MKLKICVIFLIILVGFGTSYAQDKEIVAGGTFAFRWTPNTEPDLAGYRCYISTTSNEYTFGESNAYSIYGLVSESPNHSINIPGLYFFVLTAYDTEGFESEPSNEAVLLVTAAPGITSPTNLRFVGISGLSESTIYKDTSYAEFKDQESIKYEPKELYDE